MHLHCHCCLSKLRKRSRYYFSGNLLNLPPCCHNSLPYITVFWHQITQQRTQTTCSHALRCHLCLCVIHNVTCYVYSLLSHIHVNLTDLLDIMCILVATIVIFGRLGCSLSNWSHNRVHVVTWSVKFWFLMAQWRDISSMFISINWPTWMTSESLVGTLHIDCAHFH